MWHIHVVTQPCNLSSSKHFSDQKYTNFEKIFHLSHDTVCTSYALFCNANTMITLFFLIFIHLDVIFSCESFLNSFYFRDNIRRAPTTTSEWNGMELWLRRIFNELKQKTPKSKRNQIKYSSHSNKKECLSKNMQKWEEMTEFQSHAVYFHIVKALCDWLHSPFALDHILYDDCYYVRVKIVVYCSQWFVVGGSQSCIKHFLLHGQRNCWRQNPLTGKKKTIPLNMLWAGLIKPKKNTKNEVRNILWNNIILLIAGDYVHLPDDC